MPWFDHVDVSGVRGTRTVLYCRQALPRRSFVTAAAGGHDAAARMMTSLQKVQICLIAALIRVSLHFCALFSCKRVRLRLAKARLLSGWGESLSSRSCRPSLFRSRRSAPRHNNSRTRNQLCHQRRLPH